MTTVDTARPAGEVLDSCRVRVEPALRAAVDALPTSMQRIVGYHLGWWEEDGRPTGAAGGKAIRPALTLLSAATVGGTADSAIPAAVAVELVHNFSLLHDDVMDRDLTRRHHPTAWAVFGTGPAILAGDSLLALAMDVLAASGHPAADRGTRMLSAAVQELVNGQIADLAFEQRTDVGLSECLDMTGNKTGALLGCACAIGALFGNGGFDEVGAMERFGRDLGVVFQIVDDLLGIWGDPVVTGKAADTDLRCRKKSLPVVAALTSGTPAGRELDELYHHREQELSDAELARAAELVELAGGRAWCHDRVGGLVAEALRRLPVAATPTATEAVAELGTLAQLIARRDH